jgi:hypothetical protein
MMELERGLTIIFASAGTCVLDRLQRSIAQAANRIAYASEPDVTC